MHTKTNHPVIHTSSVGLKKLFSYFLPELVTATLLYIGLEIIDFRFIACTNITSCNAALGVTNQLFHLITKIAEGFSVGMVIMCGQYNGAHQYHRTGKTVSDAFWATAVTGGAIALLLYLCAHGIYAFYEMPQEIIDLGVPFLRIRALGVFFSFVFFALIGFLRGVKNTKTPMFLFIIGAAVFLFFDYVLIFGKWGFPAMGLRGSAIATVLQYGVMLVGALIYVLSKPEHRKYGIKLFTSVKWSNIKDLIHLSWPVMIDKASFALCPIWLVKMLAIIAKTTTPATSHVLFDSFVVLRQMERVGILPAVAFAQVITFLVSNDYKIHNFTAIRKNIRKVLIISALLVGFFTFMFCMQPRFFLHILGKEKAFNDFIAYSLPSIAILMFFDVLQLILAASLRGAADVQAVMWARMVITALFFFPLAYGITLIQTDNLLFKFILLYGSVHFSYAMMSLVYLIRLKSGNWKKQSIEVERK